MLRHYFTVATRNFSRHKTFTCINVLGLALGMTCSLLIFLWVQDERSIDNFHTDSEQIFSVYKRTFADGQIEGVHGTAHMLAGELKKKIPEIQYASYYGFPWAHPETFAVGNIVQKMEGSRAGEDFFNIFSYTLLEGKAEDALKGPKNIVISRKMAQLFYGSPQRAIGQTIRYENKDNLLVTAVFEDLPENATHKFDYLLPIPVFDISKHTAEDITKYWISPFNQTYLRLHPAANPKAVEEKLRNFLDVYIVKRDNFRVELGMQRFSEVYLTSSFDEGIPSGGRIDYIRLFSGIALFLILIACINFMNLSTARSIKRAREVGVRKVVGSTRTAVTLQFLGEAVLLSCMALVLSLVLVYVLLPFFNSLTGKQLYLPVNQPLYYLLLLGLMLVTGIVAGSYPALYLSSLQPIKVLKGTFVGAQAGVLLRKGLVVFQFMLSILLLIVTMVVSQQTGYVQNKHLGYNRENLLYFHQDGELSKKNTYLLFKEQAQRMPGIKMVDISSEVPHNMGFVADDFNWEGKDPTTPLDFKPVSVGYDFVKLMGLELVAGRDFSRDRKTDSTAFMVNEEALRRMGMKNPLGKWISAWEKKGTIIGVLKDYHNNSLHKPIEPLIVDVKEDLGWSVILVRTEPGQTKQALESLENLCRQLNPGYPFVCSFIDEEYDKLYKSEQLVSKLCNIFSGVAIVISCLGLLGLAMFSTEQRKKEVGIRKVLGASTGTIIAMFSRESLILVALSFTIAAPVAYYSMRNWLNSFAYSVDLHWWVFVLAGLGALLLAVLTISLQAVKAAMANPVKSLRNE